MRNRCKERWCIASGNHRRREGFQTFASTIFPARAGSPHDADERRRRYVSVPLIQSRRAHSCAHFHFKGTSIETQRLCFDS